MRSHRSLPALRSFFKRDTWLFLLLMAWGWVGCDSFALGASNDLERARQTDRAEKQREELLREVRAAQMGLVASDWELTASVVTEVVDGKEVHVLMTELKNISGKRQMLNYIGNAFLMYEVQINRAGKSVLINADALGDRNTRFFAPGAIFRCTCQLEKSFDLSGPGPYEFSIREYLRGRIPVVDEKGRKGFVQELGKPLAFLWTPGPIGR